MGLRITPSFTIDQAVTRSQGLRQKIAEMQAKISANRSILRPSEAPDQILPRASLQAAIAKIEADSNNVDRATARLDQSNQVLQDIMDLVTQAKSLALSPEQGTVRNSQADEVDRILTEAVRLANSTYDGEYLFGGAATEAKPYSAINHSGDGRIVGASYSGSNEPSQMVVHGSPIKVRYTGTEVFSPARSNVESAALGKTGIRLGAAAGSARGAIDVVITHSLTTFAAGSGVAAGTSSGTGDTILGPSGAHQLEIIDTSGTGASGTVRLDGGAVVSFTSADHDLQVVGPNGAVVYLDMSSITAGFNGTIALQGDGTISADGGATAVPLTFASDQVVTRAGGTEMINLDTTSVTQAGADTLDVQGSADLFQTLAQLRDDLRNGKQLSDSQVSAALQRRIGDLDRHFDNLNAIRGNQSVTLENLDSLKTQSTDLQLAYKESLASIEGADLVTLAVDLQASQTQLQYSFSALSSVFNVSLLNFLK